MCRYCMSRELPAEMMVGAPWVESKTIWPGRPEQLLRLACACTQPHLVHHYCLQRRFATRVPTACDVCGEVVVIWAGRRRCSDVLILGGILVGWIAAFSLTAVAAHRLGWLLHHLWHTVLVPGFLTVVYEGGGYAPWMGWLVALWVFPVGQVILDAQNPWRVRWAGAASRVTLAVQLCILLASVMVGVDHRLACVLCNLLALAWGAMVCHTDVLGIGVYTDGVLLFNQHRTPAWLCSDDCLRRWPRFRRALWAWHWFLSLALRLAADAGCQLATRCCCRRRRLGFVDGDALSGPDERTTRALRRIIRRVRRS